MTTPEAWRSLEEAAWGPMPSLGPEWMGKSSASDSGYLLMLTDGCGVWGERRTSDYVLEKAEVSSFLSGCIILCYKIYLCKKSKLHCSHS